MEIIKIPAERIEALVGKGEGTRRMLEHRLKVRLEVDREECSVGLEGESVDEYFGKDVIRAIGRGFEAEIALKLLREDYRLKIINLDEFVRSRSSIVRLKGRIIGEKGRTRRVIEEEGECHLSIYGDTVGVIAKLDSVDIVMEAIFKLLDGAMHSTVYAYLEKSRRKLKETRLADQFASKAR